MKHFDSSCRQTAFPFKLMAWPTANLPTSRLRALMSLAALLVVSVLWGQAPDRISYQAVVRDLNNDLIADIQIGVRITILQGSPGGANVYRERHTPTTNAAGLASVQIGTGVVANGSMAAINWSAGPYFVEQAIDPNGGTNYTITNTTQLLSVPYALYAKSADRAQSAAVADEANAISAAGAGQFGVPLGTILPYAGPASSVPAGWLLCDGGAYETTLYPSLFGLIGTTYGSEPNRFKVPDLRGRGPMGRDANQDEFVTLGQIGGAKTHTLTIGEMPSHDHEATSESAGAHTHDVVTDPFPNAFFGTVSVLWGTGAGSSLNYINASGENGNSGDNVFAEEAGNHNHPITVDNNGGDQAHNNLQPYLTINFIIKAN